MPSPGSLAVGFDAADQLAGLRCRAFAPFNCRVEFVRDADANHAVEEDEAVLVEHLVLTEGARASTARASPSTPPAAPCSGYVKAPDQPGGHPGPGRRRRRRLRGERTRSGRSPPSRARRRTAATSPSTPRVARRMRTTIRAATCCAWPTTATATATSPTPSAGTAEPRDGRHRPGADVPRGELRRRCAPRHGLGRGRWDAARPRRQRRRRFRGRGRGRRALRDPRTGLRRRRRCRRRRARGDARREWRPPAGRPQRRRELRGHRRGRLAATAGSGDRRLRVRQRGVAVAVASGTTFFFDPLLGP